MIILDTEDKSLELVLDGAVTTNQLQFTASFVDISIPNYAVVGAASEDGVSNDTTPVTVVSAPGVSRTRQIKYVSIFNADTVAATVSVSINNNSTIREQFQRELNAGETLQYVDGAGWSVLTSGGIVLGALATLDTVSTPYIDDEAVALAKMADLAEATMIGRALAAGTGVPQALTPSQIRTLSSTRELLTANRTYYVRTDGSDSNDGLTDSAGGAFLTIQHAVDVAASLDLGIYDVTINVGDGTYNENVEAKSIVGSGRVSIIGNQVTPTNAVINASGICFGSNSGFNGLYYIAGFSLTGGTIGLRIFGTGAIQFEDIDFGALSSRHIESIFSNTITAVGDYSISGGSQFHIRAISHGFIFIGSAPTITITGTPNFSGAFAEAGTLAAISAVSITFVGSATGQRYSVNLNGVITSGGGGATYFPGNAAGTVATGGQYA